MPLRCIAIDDEPPALAVIGEYLSKFPALQLLQTFDDAISGAEYLRQHPVDLLFIDINMPDITGLDLVRSLEEKPMISVCSCNHGTMITRTDRDMIRKNACSSIPNTA